MGLLKLVKQIDTRLSPLSFVAFPGSFREQVWRRLRIGGIGIGELLCTCVVHRQEQGKCKWLPILWRRIYSFVKNY